MFWKDSALNSSAWKVTASWGSCISLNNSNSGEILTHVKLPPNNFQLVMLMLPYVENRANIFLMKTLLNIWNELLEVIFVVILSYIQK